MSGRFFEPTIIVHGMTMFGNIPIPSAIPARIWGDAEKCSGCFHSQVTTQFFHDEDSGARNRNAHVTPKSSHLTNFEVSVQSTALCTIDRTPRAFGGWHGFGVFGKAVFRRRRWEIDWKGEIPKPVFLRPRQRRRESPRDRHYVLPFFFAGAEERGSSSETSNLASSPVNV